jgi:2-C-methyl-D-erythritol 2,4-cyclodiphosphate synthase
MHRLKEGRPLWIGGVQLDYPLGLDGHSDADVLIHAVCDALLGAANLRDIGFHFPDTSPDCKDADSKHLLAVTISLLHAHGFVVGNIDATVCAEQPRLNPHIPSMQAQLAELMRVTPDAVSIKATTSEKMGFVGREEGITAYAVALISKR